jgi:hypothetical protein
MRIKITETYYVTKPAEKKDSSGKVITTVTIEKKIKTKVYHV